MTIFIGSLRPAKVEGAREALDIIARLDARFANCAIEPHDLTHIAPRQPLSLAEIIDGATRRADALTRVPGFQSSSVCAYAIGLEGGLHEAMPGHWALASWAVVTDGTQRGYGAGPSLILPDRVAAQVLGGEELGDLIDGLAGESVRGTRGAWGLLTQDLIGRREAFRLAVIAAFAPFYNARAWSSVAMDVVDLDPRSD